jgi:hypothetical protein
MRATCFMKLLLTATDVAMCRTQRDRRPPR